METYMIAGFVGPWQAVLIVLAVLILFGGKKLPEMEALEMAYMAIDQGAAGVDMGRNIFQSDSPVGMIQAVGLVVHKKEKPKHAFDFYKDIKADVIYCEYFILIFLPMKKVKIKQKF